LNVKDKDENTPLMMAVRNNHVEILTKLINTFDKDNKQEELIEYLNVKDKDENTPLMIASAYNYVEILKILINAFDENHKNELIEYLNVKYKYTGLMRSRKNTYGDTALMIAVSRNHTECVKELINAFDENHRKKLIEYLNVKNEDENSALMIAENNVEILKELINAFDENYKKEFIEYVNVQNKFKETALIKFASNKSSKCVKELINTLDVNQKKELMQYLNVKDTDGNTALMKASADNNTSKNVPEKIKSIAKAFGVQNINAPIIFLHMKTIPLINMRANGLISSIMFLCMVNSKSNQHLHLLFRKKDLLTIILHYLVGTDDFDLISSLFPDYKLPTLEEHKIKELE
jgi:ankyrin repeat protein